MSAVGRKAACPHACALGKGEVLLSRFLPDGTTHDILVVMSPEEAQELAQSLIKASHVASHAVAPMKAVLL